VACGNKIIKKKSYKEIANVAKTFKQKVHFISVLQSFNPIADDAEYQYVFQIS
jgi:hypothetical protein